MSYVYKKIKLSDIVLYEENPRFEKAYSETEAIQKIITDQGTKLVKLAEHIIDNGFNPIDIPIAIKRNKKYFVKEGNRRIASLRLVNDPNLVFSNEPLKRKFLLLKSQKSHLAPKVAYCAVFTDQRQADEWIRLKHAVNHEGIGTEKWNSQQANRFAKESVEDLPIELQAIEILKKNKKTSSSTLGLIPGLKITNLGRILSDPYARSKIGLKTKKNKLDLLNPKQKSLTNLEGVVQNISKTDFVVDSIYHKKDRKKFIDSIGLKKIKLPPDFLLNGAKKTGNGNKVAASIYTSLIDPAKTIQTKVVPKQLKIYKELQIVSVDLAPHATAFLLRVLIEISVKSYLKNKRVNIDANDCAFVKVSGKTIKLDSLKKKIDYISNSYITDNDLKRSVNLLNKNSFNTTLNQFVHSDIYQSTPTSVRDFWTNAESLFDFLVS